MGKSDKKKKGIKKAKAPPAETPSGDAVLQSPFELVQVEFEVSLAPKCLEDVKKAVYVHLQGMLMRFNEDLDGVVIAFSNTKLTEGSAPIVNALPGFHVVVAMDVLLFRPEKGMLLKGRVNKAGSHHIGMLVSGAFNATVPHDAMTDAYTYSEEEETWVGPGGREARVGSTVVFRYDQTSETQGLITLMGSLGPEGTGPTDDAIEVPSAELAWLTDADARKARVRARRNAERRAAEAEAASAAAAAGVMPFDAAAAAHAGASGDFDPADPAAAAAAAAAAAEKKARRAEEKAKKAAEKKTKAKRKRRRRTTGSDSEDSGWDDSDSGGESGGEVEVEVEAEAPEEAPVTTKAITKAKKGKGKAKKEKSSVKAEQAAEAPAAGKKKSGKSKKSKGKAGQGAGTGKEAAVAGKPARKKKRSST